MKNTKVDEYPTNFQTTGEYTPQPFGFGGVRAYRVSKAEAENVSKEFHIPIEAEHGDGDHYYINVNHGERHELIFGSADSAIQRSAQLVPVRFSKGLATYLKPVKPAKSVKN